jgi:putative phage-type endonuclease
VTEELEQGTDAWRLARCGSLGASSLADALAKTKTGWGASRANVMARLVVERLTGKPQDTYQNQAMRDGIEREPDARAAYQFERGVLVKQVGLIKHPTIAGTHASPDGLVGDDTMVEIKCPTEATHLETLLGAPIPQKYIYQMQWQMQCAGRGQCDFVSYHPAFPEKMQLHYSHVFRDDKLIAILEAEVREFLAEVSRKVESLTERYMWEEAA